MRERERERERERADRQTHAHTAWESIVWGDESRQLLGRIPQAVLLAHRECASLVVFGTGGSAAPDGTLEGEFTLDYMFSNWHRLARFRAFDSVDLKTLEQHMRRCARTESSSHNTLEELDACGRIFSQAQPPVSRVILVSSPTHLPRCLRDAAWLYAERQYAFRSHLFACPSDTSFAGCSPLDVAVVEPPHRGDRDTSLDAEPELLMHRLIARFYRLPREAQKDLQSSLKSRLDSLQSLESCCGESDDCSSTRAAQLGPASLA